MIYFLFIGACLVFFLMFSSTSLLGFNNNQILSIDMYSKNANYNGEKKSLAVMSTDLLSLRSKQMHVGSGGENNTIINLSNTTAMVNPDLAASQNNVFVVWEEGISGKSAIVLRKSTDGGASFGSEIILSGANNISNNVATGNGSSSSSSSSNTDYSVHPAIAASGNNVYVVWQSANSSIVLRKSTDGGASFANEIQVPKNYAGHLIYLQISASDKNVYVVWKGAISSISFTRSTDGGASFGPPIPLTKKNTTISDMKMYAVGDEVYVVWQDVIQGNYSVFFKKSSNRGESFSSVIKLNKEQDAGFQPDISVTTGDNNNNNNNNSSKRNVYVVWNSVNSGVVLRESTDSGASFSNETKLTSSNSNNSNDTAIASDIRVATSDNRVYVVWKGSSSIIMRLSPENVTTFGQEIDLAKNNINDKEGQVNLYGASNLRIVSSEGNAYVTWTQPFLSLRDLSRSQYNDIGFKAIR
jgi:hypothetical protein